MSAQAQNQPAPELRHLDYDYSQKLRTYPTLESWTKRAAELRKQILHSAGLVPLPPRPPLKATFSEKVDRGDHTIEKVYFESYPGHYVTGNLYRPKKVTGKVPAVLCPHGHWAYGRLENTPLNSGPARAANFARQGYLAFTWDMVGYNDSAAITHRFAGGHREGFTQESLWGINLLGLQLWNSMRSVDFLLSLPEVDPAKLGCTGESGGGTQTFLLAAVDERIKVVAPVNMISATMQGGSICENAPNLRIDTNNVEIAALMAPRPLLMVSATGDWTKNTLAVEYPALRAIYGLYYADDKLQAIQVDAPHNYNQESREAVYGWFAHWLQARPERTPIKEKGTSIAPLNDLLVFFGQTRPVGEKNEAQLTESLIGNARQRLAELLPTNLTSLNLYRQQFGSIFRHALMAEYPTADLLETIAQGTATAGALTGERFSVTHKPTQGRISLSIYAPSHGTASPTTPSTTTKTTVATSTRTPVQVVLLQPQDAATNAGALIEPLVARGLTVAVAEVAVLPNQLPAVAQTKFYTTYNRTSTARAVQDILTTLAAARQYHRRPGRLSSAGNVRQPLSLIAQGTTGLPALLAAGFAPEMERLIADANQFENESDAAFLKTLPVPNLRQAGDFTTALALSTQPLLLLHNTGKRFNPGKIAAVYRAADHPDGLRTLTELAPPATILSWFTEATQTRTAPTAPVVSATPAKGGRKR